MRLSNNIKILMKGETSFRDEIMKFNNILTYNTFYNWLDAENSKFLLPHNLEKICEKFSVTQDYVIDRSEREIEMELLESDVNKTVKS